MNNLQNIGRILGVIVLILFWVGLVSANEWVHMAKGSELLKQGKEIEAIKEFEKAIDENPSIIEAYQKIGYIYQYEIKNLQKAIKVYSKGLEYEPDDYQLNLNLMYAYFKLDEKEKAIKAYKKVAKLRPDDTKFSFPKSKLIVFLENMKMTNKIKFCKELLSVNPTDTTIRKLLAEMHLEQKDYQEAKKHFEMLIKNGDASGDVYYGLGITNYYLKEYNFALENLSKAEKLGEYVPEQYFRMVKGKLKKK